MESLLRAARAWTDEGLRTWLRERSGWTPSLQERALHVMEGAGKALRPALVAWSANLLAGQPASDLPSERVRLMGLALEMIHTYSLVHDDLPAMDDDSSRRGRPTLHVLYGEAEAILVGDALLSAAFEVMASAQGASTEAVSELARAAGGAGMIQGQRRDLLTETECESDPLLRLRETHRLKTGALFASAFVLGALAVSGSSLSAGQREAWRRWGAELGLLFQIVDDVLDATASSQTLGKTAGKDARDGKVTYVELLGLDVARSLARSGGEDWVLARPSGVSEVAARELVEFVLERLS